MADTKKILKAESAEGFPFTFYIEKAVPDERDGQMIIRGIASTINVDHDNERMAKDALFSMAEKINYESVPLRVEHNKDPKAVVGSVDKAWVDERNQLWVEASLDKAHPVAPVLYNSLKEGVRMGLSVGGRVKSATKEFVESVGKMVKTFYDVMLDEVSVTYKPANYDSWLVTKSISADKKEWNAVRREFLTENPTLDYLQVFAKSVPDKAWHEVEVPNLNKNESMSETETKEKNSSETETKEKKESSETTEKNVSQAEFAALKSAVDGLAKSIEKFVGIAKDGMHIEARDQDAPSKAKENHEVAAKAEGEKTDAKDTTNPDKKKPEFNPDLKAKAQKTSEKDGDKYEMETVERAVKAIEDLAKAMETTETETKEKAEGETKEDETTKKESEETTEKSTDASSLDKFVAAVSHYADVIVQKNRDSKKRFAADEYKMIADMIKQDPSFQADFRKMMKEPGHKKSLVMGIPMMVTKEGKRYQLSARPIDGEEPVEKSEKPKNFKDAWKSQYSPSAAKVE